jgi:hypothetical protein
MILRERQSLKLILMIVLGLAFAFSAFTVARSQTNDVRGPFMLAGGDRTMIWRIDQATGKVSFCTRDTASTDSKYLATYSPYCSNWSPN